MRDGKRTVCFPLRMRFMSGQKRGSLEATLGSNIWKNTVFNVASLKVSADKILCLKVSLLRRSPNFNQGQGNNFCINFVDFVSAKLIF